MVEPVSNKQAVHRWLRFAQALVTIGLCYWLLRQVDWGQLRSAVLQMRWQPLTLSILFLLMVHVLNVVRWRYLTQTPTLRFEQMLRWYAIGLFSNNFLPTGIGGDGVRVALLSRSIDLGRAMFAVTADRGIGLVAISALVAMGLWAGLPPGFEQDGWRRLVALSGGTRLVVIMAVAIVLLIAWLAVRRLPRLQAWVAQRQVRWQLPRWRMREWVRHGAVAYGISVAAHVCIVAATWAILVALRIEVPLAASLWLVVLSSLSLLLPVTVNGMGIVESVYVLVLGSYGVAPAAGLSVALMVRVIALLISLSGGVLLIDRRAGELRSAVE